MIIPDINEDEKIPLELYRFWQQDRVTKTFIKFLQKAEEEASNQRLDRNLTLQQDGQLEAARRLGYYEAIHDLLEKFTYDCTTTEAEEQ